MIRSGITWIVAFLAAGVLSAILGILIALPCLRVQSDFLGLIDDRVRGAFHCFRQQLGVNYLAALRAWPACL